MPDPVHISTPLATVLERLMDASEQYQGDDAAHVHDVRPDTVADGPVDPDVGGDYSEGGGEAG